MTYQEVVDLLRSYQVPHRMQDGKIQALDLSLLPSAYRAYFDARGFMTQSSPVAESGGVSIFEQDSEPTEAKAGDFWITEN